MVYVMIGTGINTFFSARYPSISVNTYCAQVIAYPCGKFLEWCLPRHKFRLFGREFSLNPGPFNRKEHMLITIMANVRRASDPSLRVLADDMLRSGHLRRRRSRRFVLCPASAKQKLIFRNVPPVYSTDLIFIQRLPQYLNQTHLGCV